MEFYASDQSVNLWNEDSSAIQGRSKHRFGAYCNFLQYEALAYESCFSVSKSSYKIMYTKTVEPFSLMSHFVLLS